MDLQEVDTLFGKSSFLDSDKVHKMINHPLHIIDKSGNLSPSAFIPFCKFDKWMGVKVEQFDVPVCDIFQATILNDHLCYKIDQSKLRKRFSASAKSYEEGITFYIDVNEDRQLEAKYSNFMIYLDTLGDSI